MNSAQKDILPLKCIDKEKLIKKIRDYLQNHQPDVISDEEFRQSAVLIIIYPFAGENCSLILTKRNRNLKKHAGEISFPGGRFEPERDKNKVDTALRESMEEINIDINNIEILGQMDDFATLTGYVITPVVGLAKKPIDFKKSKEEVEKIFIIPLEFFINKKNFDDKYMEIGGEKFPINVFNYYEEDGTRHTIWGATAHILVEFVSLFLGIKLTDKKRPKFPRAKMLELIKKKNAARNSRRRKKHLPKEKSQEIVEKNLKDY